MSPRDKYRLNYLLQFSKNYKTTMGHGSIFDHIVNSKNWDQPEVATPKHLRGK